jgi:hypothetical protein
MTAFNPEDLDMLEVTLLGVLSVGLPPSRAAGSDTFRVDHVTAVIAGMREAGDASAHLREDGLRVTEDFRGRLRAAIRSLEEKEIVVAPVTGMPAAAGGFEAGLALDLVDPDEHPAVLDRYLAQLCMEVLFNIPEVYPYLMERYSSSGEVWRRLREGGYQRD